MDSVCSAVVSINTEDIITVFCEDSAKAEIAFIVHNVDKSTWLQDVFVALNSICLFWWLICSLLSFKYISKNTN
jgi:hypothetical protein